MKFFSLIVVLCWWGGVSVAQAETPRVDELFTDPDAPVASATAAPKSPAASVASASAEASALYQLKVEDIEKSVADALSKAGAGQKIQVILTGPRNKPIYESPTAVDVEIKTLNFDARTQKWTANLMFVAKDGVQSAMPIGGRYQEIVALPVLNKRMDSTGIIKESDITTLDYPLARMRKDMVMDRMKLIGQSPRRVVSPGRPIREDELTSPRMVQKDDLVRMRYVSGPMIVETGAVALDSGGVGDSIRVRNSDSQAIVRAVVESKGVVNVPGGNPVTTAPPALKGAFTPAPETEEKKP